MLKPNLKAKEKPLERIPRRPAERMEISPMQPKHDLTSA
jgi:hypothetical protein